MQHLNVAITCSSNINRSMEAHAYLAKKGFKVKSFGSADMVRLPGLTPEQPNCYDFGTPYKDIYEDLVNKNREYYTQNGLLNILDRNKRIKLCPERLQDSTDVFDVIITCEERVFDQVIEFFSCREPVLNKIVHIVNVDIEDSQEEATIGSFLISDMVAKMAQSHDLNEDLDELVQALEIKSKKTMLNCIMTY